MITIPGKNTRKAGTNEGPARAATPRPQDWLAALILALAVLITFQPTTRNGFVNYDDPVYVTENPMVQKGLTAEGVGWAFLSTAGSNWHPITWLSHMADCEVFGLKPGGHHFVSNLFHALNAALVFLLWYQMTGERWAALAAAALFGLHPLRVESVAWAAERKDVLCALFGLLALLAYAAYAQGKIQSEKLEKAHLSPALSPGRRGRWIWYGLALLFFALGLMSKPMLVTWPFVMLLLDWWPLKRVQGSEFRVQSWKPLVIEKLPFFALTVVACVITYQVQKATGAMAETLPLDARMANAGIAYVRYLGKFGWPTNLSVHYPHPDYWPAALVTASLLGLVIISGLAAWQWKNRPYLLLGWFWYLGTAVPVIGLVQVGSQSMADRYTYVPMLGIAVMVTWGAKELASRLGQRPQIGIAAVLVAAAAGVPLTIRQIHYWRDSETLFRHALAATPNNGLAHGSLARALLEQERGEEALEHYQEAVRLQPKDAVARNGLGTLLMQKGNLAEAKAQFEEVLRTRPSDFYAHNNLGLLLARTGNYPAALDEFQKAVQLNPQHAEARHNLGLMLAAKGDWSGAIQQYQEAIRLRPDLAKAHKNLGVALARAGRLDEAIASFQQALRLQPNYGEAQKLLNEALAAKATKAE